MRKNERGNHERMTRRKKILKPPIGRVNQSVNQEVAREGVKREAEKRIEKPIRKISSLLRNERGKRSLYLASINEFN